MADYRELVDWIKSHVGTAKYPNQNRFAEAVGMKSRSEIYDFMKGRRLSGEKFVQYIMALGARILLPKEYAELSEEPYPVPLVKPGMVDGKISFAADSEVEFIAFFQYKWLKSKVNPAECYLLRVTNAIMDPELRKGDKVLVDVSERGREISSGEIYAIRLRSNLSFYRVVPGVNAITLKGSGADSTPEVCEYDDMGQGWEVVGKVIWVSRSL